MNISHFRSCYLPQMLSLATVPTKRYSVRGFLPAWNSRDFKRDQRFFCGIHVCHLQ